MVLQWSSPLEVLAPVVYTNMIITVMINYHVIIILEAINIYDNDNGGINHTGRPTSYKLRLQSAVDLEQSKLEEL